MIEVRWGVDGRYNGNAAACGGGAGTCGKRGGAE